jgi:peptidoglycan glycosyltransferase
LLRSHAFLGEQLLCELTGQKKPGDSVVTTIRYDLQEVAYEALKEKNGAVIVMDPSTGKILAMASYPDYDLNSPLTPTSFYSENWDNLSSSEKNEQIQKMWKIRSVNETYEPGSVFKLVTAAVALEEHITDTDISDDFY